MQQHFRIVGSGAYQPPTIVTAAEVDQRLGAPAGWTARHSGVMTRFECLPPSNLGEMANHAAVMALTRANLDWSDIDLIIDCSTSVYQPIPCNAAVYQGFFGEKARGIPCLDVHGTCLGFVLGLNIVNGLFLSGAYRRVMMVASEGALAGVNWREWESASLMSDGAAAIIVEHAPTVGTFAYEHRTYSQFATACEVRSGGHRQGPFEYHPDRESDYRFSMDGPLLFKTARKLLPDMVRRVIQASGVMPHDLQVVPHQASPRAVESVRRLLDHPSERFHNRASSLGNMVAASIPTMLHMLIADRTISRGDKVMLLGTSAGYSQAACTFEF